jgi:Ca-activated chloride channel homolog
MKWNRREAIRFFGIGGFSPIAISQVRSEDTDFVLRLNSNLVVLDVSVTGADGVPVAGIGRNRFRISEDGKAQIISQYSADERPVSLGFVVDMSGSMSNKVLRVRRAVSSFLSVSNPEDLYFVVGFNDIPQLGLRDAAFTGKAEEVRDAVASFRAEGRTCLYDGVSVALNHIQTSSLERRYLVLVSDGKDTASSIRQDEAMQRCRSSRVTIFTLGLFEDEDEDQNSGVLKQIAKVTGGQYFHPADAKELSDSCVRIARDIRARYTLAYTPPGAAKRALRRIKVDLIPRPDEGKRIVRTRTEYTLEPVAQQ